MSFRTAALCVLLFASTATAEPLSLSDALARAEEVSAAIQLQQLSSELRRTGATSAYPSTWTGGGPRTTSKATNPMLSNMSSLAP